MISKIITEEKTAKKDKHPQKLLSIHLIHWMREFIAKLQL